MARKTPTKQPVPATLEPRRAVELLRQRLADFDQVLARRDNPEVDKWVNTTGAILDGAFGKPDGEHHEMTLKFLYPGGVSYSGQSDEYYEQQHKAEMLERKAVLDSCIEQLELLAPPPVEGVAVEQAAEPTLLDTVLLICDRFHHVAGQLAQRRQGRPTLEIRDKYDVQDLLHALFRLHFDDIRPEECTPSYAGGSSRMDFLLKEERIVIEAKMTREGLDAKKVAEELMVDAARYRQHRDCKTLVCFVYDPSGRVKNPRGIERDLAKLSGRGLAILCAIRP